MTTILYSEKANTTYWWKTCCPIVSDRWFKNSPSRLFYNCWHMRMFWQSGVSWDKFFLIQTLPRCHVSPVACTKRNHRHACAPSTTDCVVWNQWRFGPQDASGLPLKYAFGLTIVVLNSFQDNTKILLHFLLYFHQTKNTTKYLI